MRWSGNFKRLGMFGFGLGDLLIGAGGESSRWKVEKLPKELWKSWRMRMRKVGGIGGLGKKEVDGVCHE